MPKAIASIVIEDYNGETSVTKPNLQDSDAGATNYGSLATDLDEIKDAILTVIIGEVRYVQLGVQFPESVDPVAAVQAVREAKWLITMRDTTQYLDAGNLINNPGYNSLFSFEIATPDRTLLPANSDEVNLTVAPWIAFVAAMEANVRSPSNRSAGAGVTPTQEVVSITYVGRNL